MTDLVSVAFNDKKAVLKKLNGLEALFLANKAVEKCENGGFSLLAGEKGQSFEPTGVVAVSSSSNEKELCKDIVSTMMAPKLQKQSVGIGFPVNKEAAQQMIADTSKSSVSYAVSDDQGRVLDYGPENNEITSRFVNLGDEVDIPATVDINLMEIIMEISKDYFNGSCTSQEAAHNICEKTSLYLLE